MYGVPVIVGGLYSKVIVNDVEDEMIPPSVYVSPEEIKNSLRELCLQKELRLKIGDDLYDFVNRQWSNKAVAQRFLDISNGDFDEKWYFNPSELTYFNGWGLSEEELRLNLTNIIETEGFDKLCLVSPILSEKLKKFLKHD
jgi:hypothetical protein